MIKILISALLAFGTATVTAPPPALADQTVIEGVNIVRDIPCKGKDIGIYGATNTINLTGECGVVTIVGSQHKVTFDKAAAVAISGVNMTVTGNSTSSLSVEVAENTVSTTIVSQGKPATVAIYGTKNDVRLSLEAPTNINIVGAEHTLSWSLAKGVEEPDISAGGIGHIIERQ